MALRTRQLELIEAIVANPSASNVELAKLAHCNRNTVTEWKRDPEFKEALKQRLQEIWQDSEAIAVASMRKLATEGHFQANKYILDSLGYAPTTKIEADISQEVFINVGVEDEE